MKKIVVSCPAESRVFPGESADDTLLNSVAVHNLQEVFRGSHAGFFVLVNHPESLIPPAEYLSFLPNLIRE
jgi:hypothetical protein